MRGLGLLLLVLFLATAGSATAAGTVEEAVAKTAQDVSSYSEQLADTLGARGVFEFLLYALDAQATVVQQSLESAQGHARSVDQLAEQGQAVTGPLAEKGTDWADGAPALQREVEACAEEAEPTDAPFCAYTAGLGWLVSAFDA